jgi:DNA-binding LacI/PurR family transcriptional regulator
MSYIESQRLGGIIFANTPHEIAGTPIIEQAGIPRVALLSAHGFDFPGVEFDGDGWQQRAFDQLAAQGRKRVALLMLNAPSYMDEVLDKLCVERGLSMPLHWRHTVGAYNASEARRIVQLLMQLPPSERPNGLVITDDNLVEHALAGLVAARVHVPEDIAVVGHCNFPYPPPSVVPITRLGYHIGQALRICLDLLDRQRRGEVVPKRTTLPALFEEEAAQVVAAPVS